MRRVYDHADRGSESVELAILLPVAVVVLTLLVAGSRVALAGDRISGVAGITARDASIARSPQDAQLVARTSAEQALADRDIHCASLRVDVDTAGFAAPPNTAPAVTVRLWCDVNLSDLALPGLPGTKTLYDTATSVLDPARDTEGQQ